MKLQDVLLKVRQGGCISQIEPEYIDSVLNETRRDITLVSPKLKDMTGERYGKLTVLEIAGCRKSSAAWLCKCDCGNYSITTRTNLVKSQTTSCGCNKEGLFVKQNKIGNENTPGYRIWIRIKCRCYDKNNKAFKDYGGRGIIVCDRWQGVDGFKHFIEDMGIRPSSCHTIERKDTDGDYEPINCKWATMKEQSINKRSTKYVEYNGERLPFSVFCERYGLSYKKTYPKVRKLNWDVRTLL